MDTEPEFLSTSDLDKVAPKFRQMVLDAWAKGEAVPYGVIYLSDRPPTPEEIEFSKELEKMFPDLIK